MLIAPCRPLQLSDFHEVLRHVDTCVWVSSWSVHMLTGRKPMLYQKEAAVSSLCIKWWILIPAFQGEANQARHDKPGPWWTQWNLVPVGQELNAHWPRQLWNGQGMLHPISSSYTKGHSSHPLVSLYLFCWVTPPLISVDSWTIMVQTN